VLSKAPKRQTQNAGSILNLTLVDSHGTQIEATFFKDAADHFDKIIEHNKVYLFSDGNVKLANKKFAQVKNDFCVIF
jgi:replication factor A1